MAKRSEIQHQPYPTEHPLTLMDGESVKYRAWRDNRLQLQVQQRRNNNYIIELSSEIKSSTDHAALNTICCHVRDHGFAVYQWTDCPEHTQAAVGRLNRALGLTQTDHGVVQSENGLSLLTDMANTPRGRFIPYTTRAMGWHTDGYYNDPSATLRSFSLHCINPAASGGALSLLDYELLLIALHEENADLLTLLSHPECMTLPANKDNLGHDRPDRTVPVWFTQADNKPGLRFTTRTQHISWRTPDTKAAAEHLVELVDSCSQWHHTIRLESGQGVITRNILHRREAFKDSEHSPPREILRGRYLDMPNYPQ